MNNAAIRNETNVFVFGSLSFYLLIGLYIDYRSYKSSKKRSQYLKKNKPLDVSEFNNMKHNKGDIVLLRVLHELPKPQDEQRDFCTNHEYFSYPDERQLIKDKVSEQKRFYRRKTWNGYDVKENGNSVELVGLGIAFDELIEVNVETTRTITSNEIPFYKKVYSFFSGTIECVLGVLGIVLFGTWHAPVSLKGIKIGTFNIKYDWLKGSILAQCQIGAQGLKVQSLSPSQELLIQAAQRQFQKSKSLLALMIVFSGLSIFKLISSIMIMRQDRKRMRRQNEQPQILKYKQFVFESDQQRTTCDICMVKNKSVVFDSCGHLTACVECSGNIGDKKCPFCKTEIHAKRIFSVENREQQI